MNYFYENRSDSLYDDIQVSIYENENLNYLAHWHNDAELSYIIEGNIYIGVNNQKYLLKEGDIALFNSGDIHYYESSEIHSKMITLVFKTEFIGLPSIWPPKGRFSSPVVSNSIIESCELSKIKAILKNILGEFNSKNDYYELFIKAGLNELCGILLRNVDIKIDTSQGNSSKIRSMQRVFSYIEDNYHLDISLEMIAKDLNMDPYNLSKYFNVLTGTNLKTYINTMRLFNAEDMIINTNKAITDIALDSGFNSIRSFNRAFKKLKGYTPSSLRKNKK